MDSILIDEARTPLIIIGSSEQNTNHLLGPVNRVDPAAQTRREGRSRKAAKRPATTGSTRRPAARRSPKRVCTGRADAGVENLYDPADDPGAAPRSIRLSVAHTLNKRDVDYMVKKGDSGKVVIIVDEFTGRLMPGRRWSDGLHQAVEAKEGIKIEPRTRRWPPSPSRTFFRMYDKLCGHDRHRRHRGAGVRQDLRASTCSWFRPTARWCATTSPTWSSRPNARSSTPSSKTSRRRSRRGSAGAGGHDLDRVVARCWPGSSRSRACRTTCLNAKKHEREAEIVAQAGRHGAVTISTNMAGRGTDIVLGGNMRRVPGSGEVRATTRTPRRYPSALLADFEGSCGEEREAVVARRRAPHSRHGAPREPPHRQSAARPRRPPGRRRARASSSSRWKTICCASSSRIA